jgi:hypothetical protein
MRMQGYEAEYWTAVNGLIPAVEAVLRRGTYVSPSIELDNKI